jgi:hypothetical protein
MRGPMIIVLTLALAALCLAEEVNPRCQSCACALAPARDASLRCVLSTQLLSQCVARVCHCAGCNTYTRTSELCSDCDCDHTVMIADGFKGKLASPHCSGAGGVFASSTNGAGADDAAAPATTADASAGTAVPQLVSAAAPPPPPPASTQASEPCESWCNKYTRVSPSCAGCDCDQTVMVSDGNDGASEHCSGAGGMWAERPEDHLLMLPDVAADEGATSTDDDEDQDPAPGPTVGAGDPPAVDTPATPAQQHATADEALAAPEPSKAQHGGPDGGGGGGTSIVGAPPHTSGSGGAKKAAKKATRVWNGKGGVPEFTGRGKMSTEGSAVGPVPQPGHPEAGWVVDGGGSYEVSEGAVKLTGNARAFLVQDSLQTSWAEHKYMRLDLSRHPLSFTLDLSGVPCGCLACVYLVAMADPSAGDDSYCDMAENVKPGLDGGPCTELDLVCTANPQEENSRRACARAPVRRANAWCSCELVSSPSRVPHIT